MSGSGMIMQTLLPGKSPEALQRNGTQKKGDQSFAELFEKRMQVRRENATVSVKPSNRVDRQTTATERQKEAKMPDRAEATEKPLVKNPAKEKMKELMKKVKDTLEAMKDPEASPEQLQKLAEDLKGYMGEIKGLVEAAKEPEQSVVVTDIPQETNGTVADSTSQSAMGASQTLSGQAGTEKLDPTGNTSEVKQNAKPAEVHQNNRQAPELKGNPILKEIEKVIDAQADILADYPDVKKALEEVLADVKAIQSIEVTKPEAAFMEKLEALMTKMNGIVVKMPETKVTQTNADSEDAAEPEASKTGEENPVQKVTEVAKGSEVNSQSTDADTANGQREGQDQQAYASQQTNGSKDSKGSEESSKNTATTAAPVEKPNQAAPKQPMAQTPQTVQNPQAFQDTLDAIKEGVQAKGQFQSRIMEQVIESVKTNFKAEDMKSEMIMKLKPESLGNVSLKVSIEKGVVLAELQVESQAVKQALESNLQDLRSALQDKGFNVFDLDVSVRKENQNQQQTDNKRGSQSKTARVEMHGERLEQRLLSLEAVHNQSTIDYLG